jgi:hypothetical protein
MCTEDQKLYYTAEENNLSLNVEKKKKINSNAVSSQYKSDANIFSNYDQFWFFA